MKKVILVSCCAIAFALAACSGSDDQGSAVQKQADLVASQKLNDSIKMKSGVYKMTPACLDTTKNLSTGNILSTLEVADDGSALLSTHNLQAECTTGCESHAVGTYNLSQIQFTMKISRIFDEAKRHFVPAPADTISPAFQVLSYSRDNNTLQLLDSSSNNVCEGRMTWNLSF